MQEHLTAELERQLGAYWALAYDEGRTQTSQGTEANEKLSAIRALFKDKDAEISALQAPAATKPEGCTRVALAIHADGNATLVLSFTEATLARQAMAAFTGFVAYKAAVPDA